MRIISNAAAMQKLALQWKCRGVRVGFVPTMGYLHAGHLSLVREARKRVGKSGKIVVSIYVNPTQFAPTEDLAKYPRDLKRDLKLCRDAGVDVVFTPGDAAMYLGGRPQGPARGDARPTGFSTYVVEEKLSRTMEGAARPTHFRGVTTVVAKLFNLVLPDVAIFGQKDFQQAAIIKRMAADLNFPVKIIVAPTLREPDGLAMSSRNKHLAGDLRRQATVLHRAIERARQIVRTRDMIGMREISSKKLKNTLSELVLTEKSARMDYVEFFEPKTLAPVSKVAHGAQMALAVFVGKTRLIDNARL
jgi:pantoate--beta-alanine ligase